MPRRRAESARAAGADTVTKVERPKELCDRGGNCACVEKFARAATPGVTRKFTIIEFDAENFVRARPLGDRGLSLRRLRKV